MEERRFILDDQTYKAFRDYIQQLTGINYTDAKRYLLDGRVRRRMVEIGLDDGPSYLRFLQTDPRGKSEVESLIDQVSIHETSFFRHQSQIDILRDLLEELVAARQARGPQRLRLWSAACSSGEEPYTLAMVVRDLLPSGWRVEIYGTDISSGVIAKARTARYARRTGQTVPEQYARYLAADPADKDQFVVVPDITRMVTFSVLSLVDDVKLRSMRDMDVIFCRNVLIYFDQDSKRKVLEALHQSLVPGGHLVLGPSDSLHGLNSPFQRTPHSVYNFYQRAAAPAAVAASVPTTPPLPARKRRVEAPPPPAATPAPVVSGAESFRLKMLINRMDLGLKNLNQELQDALVKSVDALGVISTSVDNAAKEREWSRQVESELARVGWQITRILQWLEVGDRTGQKVEAMRAHLQELSDRLFGADREAPDLRVNTGSFDHSILPTESEAAKHQGAMSQDEIDQLFG